jgi:tRNA (cytidine32/uridine32-2'-O)-methyltransferase
MQIPVRIVLVETSHPGNIGASARAMKTMGLAELVLVRPKAFPHPEATARASGADDVLAGARVVDSLEAATADCGFVVGASARSRSVAWPTVDPRVCAELVHARASANRVAVVLGPEQSGLTNEDLGRCQRLVRIPTQPQYGSLNLAMAVQVLCYELRMAWLAAAPDPGFIGQSGAPALGRRTRREPLATTAELEGFYAHLERALGEAGFLHTDHPRQLKLKLRRIFQRAELDRNEINILRGVLTALDPARGAGDS